MHPRSSERKTVSPKNPVEPTPLAIAAVILANAALAFGPWFVRLADVGPVSSAFWRIALAAPLLAGAALATGWRPSRNTGAGGLSGLLWAMIAVGGVCFAADLASWHLGILRTTLANATLFGNCAILMFPIYGFLAARSWPTRIQGIALLLATVGAVLLMGRSYQLDPRNLAGDMLCLLAGVLYTGYFILMARARATLPPVPALALSTLASILPLLLFALLLGETMWPTHWGPLVGLALVSQVIGQGLMLFALGKLPPLVVGLALLVQPVVGATIGWTVYGEKLGLPDLFGASLVAVALVLVSRRARD
ncbi:DMT family transporter [Sphingomonas echinoides]|uniref:DMT family transporter n=1 Tax=Sphingomonas echinoides TaxID=59803 RepID=UPI00241333DD|nr:DMT family transporter [Sphingomonas echinoides]